MIKEKSKNFFAQKKNKRKTKGQSLVEIALTLPILLILLSGLTELGFMLNYYLSLVDASREVARLFSNYDHEYVDPNTGSSFYESAVDQIITILEPSDTNDTTRKIRIYENVIDPVKNHDNEIIVSVYSISGSNATLLNEHHWSGRQASHFDEAEVNNRIAGTAPNSGALVIEVFYTYEQVLDLPWMQPVLGDSTVLYAYTFMPQSSSEPTPTP